MRPLHEIAWQCWRKPRRPYQSSRPGQRAWPRLLPPCRLSSRRPRRRFRSRRLNQCGQPALPRPRPLRSRVQPCRSSRPPPPCPRAARARRQLPPLRRVWFRLLRHRCPRGWSSRRGRPAPHCLRRPCPLRPRRLQPCPHSRLHLSFPRALQARFPAHPPRNPPRRWAQRQLRSRPRRRSCRRARSPCYRGLRQYSPRRSNPCQSNPWRPSPRQPSSLGRPAWHRLLPLCRPSWCRATPGCRRGPPCCPSGRTLPHPPRPARPGAPRCRSVTGWQSRPAA